MVRRDELDVHALAEHLPRLREAVRSELTFERAHDVRERLDRHGLVDRHDGGGRVLDRVDRRDRAADRMADDDRRREARIEDGLVDRIGHGLEVVSRQRRTAAVARQVECDRRVARRQGFEHGIPHAMVERQSVQEDERAAGRAEIAVRAPCEVGPAHARGLRRSEMGCGCIHAGQGARSVARSPRCSPVGLSRSGLRRRARPGERRATRSRACDRRR